MATLAWLLAAFCAGALVLWAAGSRIRRIEQITAIVPGAAPDAASPTGYVNGMRSLVLPGPGHAGQEWIIQTQEMIRRGEWRVRRADYDNAPVGREVRSASPYRWWLAAAAWLDRLRSGRPAGLAVERAALTSNPALHLVLLLATAALAARVAGGLAAAAVAVGIAAMFPFAGAFLPGQPDDAGLGLAAALWSLLLLHGGIRAGAAGARRWFIAAGVAGGCGLWVDVAGQLLVLGGIGAAALGLAWAGRRTGGTSVEQLPWRAWAGAGAIAVVAAWLVEFPPAQALEWRLDIVHPLHALAWLGGAELIRAAAGWIRPGRIAAGRREIVIAALGTVAVAAVPLAPLVAGGKGVAAAAAGAQLTSLAGGVAADSLWAWISRDGMTAAAWGALLPLLAIAPAAWLLVRRATNDSDRQLIGFAFGPVVVLAVAATMSLGWWILLDAALLALFAALAAAARPTSVRALGGAALAVALLPGLLQVLPERTRVGGPEVTEADAEALIERDLAHWLAQRSPEPGAIVLAPPELTAALCFYGGLRGLGTPYRENDEGFSAAVRIAAAASTDEAQALAQRRQLGWIVMPSWDSYLDEYARLGSTAPDKSLVALLRQWLPPRWLRPIPYQAPGIPGFEGRSAVVFAVVEPQDNATALSRLAEYFIEMQMPPLAVAVAGALRQSFPNELVALVGRAQVELAQGDAAAVAATLGAIQAEVDAGAEEFLPWDRRVALALVLAQARRTEAAKAQVARCLAAADEERLRSLTTLSLRRLLVLGRAFGAALPEPRLHEFARRLLPAEWREGL